MKVLVVDDSAMTRMVAKRTLLGLGIDDVDEAEDGQVGLDKFNAGEYDIVFTDWNMPVMDGLGMLKAIREINKDVPIIMITTEGSRAKVTEAIQHGISDYLVKPFTPDSLKEKLCKWVQFASK
jgi:two-component system, chemotaxis family, chemotaxis protein CheY